MSKKLVFISGLIILIISNFIIYTKEDTKRNGQVILLKLRPVDPRSLMQGDYMALGFEAADKITEKKVDTGYVVLEVNSNRVASFKKIYSGENLKNNEVKVRYRIRNNRVKFATNAYFFQEGTGHIYEDAEYGEFRLNNKGEILLTNLRDENLKRLP